MTLGTLLVRSLRFFRRTHMGILSGAAVGTAILTGALIVGDSVRYSLARLARARLGTTEYAIVSQDRYFRKVLADSMQKRLGTRVAPLLMLNGIVSTREQGARVNRVQALGVGERFWRIGGISNPFTGMGEDEAVVNHRLAKGLDLQPGDEFILRVGKESVMPGDMPFASEDSRTVAHRLLVRAVLPDVSIGRFGIESSQVSPFNVFLPYARLADRNALSGRANVLLVTGGGSSESDIHTVNEAFDASFTLHDAQYRLRELSTAYELISDRYFIDVSFADTIMRMHPEAEGVLTYFVNRFESAGRAAPYAFASTLPAESGITLNADDIVINEWMAEDLRVSRGDSIRLFYWIPRSGQRLEENVHHFRVSRIVAMRGWAADRDRTPPLPGLTDTDNCRDWDPGIPIDLSQIRDRDEAYWNRYRAAPRAFVSRETANKLWANRFGKVTSIRFPKSIRTAVALEDQINRLVEPSALGLIFRPVRRESIEASMQGVDFGQLFIGLSFFTMSGALLLTGLLFVLAIEQRTGEAGTLRALGYTRTRVRSYYLLEGTVLAAGGSLGGILAGILYTRLILYALGTLWRGAVGTSSLVIHIRPAAVFTGGIIGMLLSLIAMAVALRRQGRKTIHDLQRTIESSPERRPILSLISAFLFILIAVILIVSGHPGSSRSSAGIFWGAGSTLLAGSMCLVFYCLAGLQTTLRGGKIDLRGIGLRNLARKKGRSLTTVALLAVSIFIIVAVSANRFIVRDAGRRESGTGGFDLYGETTLPVRSDLNSRQSFQRFGLKDAGIMDVQFVQIRVREGGDASCLNLNRIQHPRILGINPEELRLRKSFTFSRLMEGIDAKDPWNGLTEPGEAGLIPAVADLSVMVWGLGIDVGDTLITTDEHGNNIRLRFIGGLANSIFQGSILISHDHFISSFPSITGSRVFLIDVPDKDASAVRETLLRNMQDYGIELTPSAERLAAFLEVQNTYLNIFLALGGLGLLIGTVGFGIIVFRNVMERKSELALLRAVGYRIETVQTIIMTENVLILLAGLVTGSVCAFIAVLPTMLTPGTGIPIGFTLVVLGLILASGVGWSYGATKLALRAEMIPALRDE